jgi:hypothetical protein
VRGPRSLARNSASPRVFAARGANAFSSDDASCAGQSGCRPPGRQGRAKRECFARHDAKNAHPRPGGRGHFRFPSSPCVLGVGHLRARLARVPKGSLADGWSGSTRFRNAAGSRVDRRRLRRRESEPMDDLQIRYVSVATGSEWHRGLGRTEAEFAVQGATGAPSGVTRVGAGNPSPSSCGRIVLESPTSTSTPSV